MWSVLFTEKWEGGSRVGLELKPSRGKMSYFCSGTALYKSLNTNVIWWCVILRIIILCPVFCTLKIFSPTNLLLVGICASTIPFPLSLNVVWGNSFCITSLPCNFTAGKILALCRQNTTIYFGSVFNIRQSITLCY